MTQQKDAFIALCEQAYNNIKEDRWRFNGEKFDMNFILGRDYIKMESGGVKVCCEYTPQRLVPPLGTPIIVWDADKSEAQYAFSAGDRHEDGRILVCLPGKGMKHAFVNWRIIQEVPDPE